MSEWCHEHRVTSTSYVVIDVEGYEPKVLRGMHLEQPANQKLFPHIQYELGGTWGARDPRHGGVHEWSQYDAAKYMEQSGYLLFLIGEDGWMPVNADFFDDVTPGFGHHMHDEGFGIFVQGNLLCLHSQYASKKMMNLVVQTLLKSSAALTRCSSLVYTLCVTVMVLAGSYY